MLSVVLIAMLSVSATPARVHVAAGELDAPIAQELAAELPGSVATSTSSADLLLQVERKADELEVTLRDQLGRPVLTRTVSLVDGLTPALRRIVLVVAHVAESGAERSVEHGAESAPLREVPPAFAPSPAPALAQKPFGLSTSAAFALAWWTTSPGPQIGATAAVSIDPGPIDVGARVTFVGAPCCRQVGQRISADARELTVIAEAGYRALELDHGVSLRLHAGAGIGWVHMDVTPDAFDGPKMIQFFDATEPVAELGATAAIDVLRDRLSLEVSAGVLLRGRRLEVALPEFYGAGTLDPGLINPWIRVGTALDIL